MDPLARQSLRDLATRYRVHACCPKCGSETPVNLMRWAQLVGWDFPFATIQPLVRCGSCGNHVGIEIRLSEGPQKQNEAGRRD